MTLYWAAFLTGFVTICFKLWKNEISNHTIHVATYSPEKDDGGFYLNLSKHVLNGHGVSFKEHHEYTEYKGKHTVRDHLCPLSFCSGSWSGFSWYDCFHQCAFRLWRDHLTSENTYKCASDQE